MKLGLWKIFREEVIKNDRGLKQMLTRRRRQGVKGRGRRSEDERRM